MIRVGLENHPPAHHTGLLALYYLDQNCINSTKESLHAIFRSVQDLRLTQFPGQAVPVAAHTIRVLSNQLKRYDFPDFDPRLHVDKCMRATTDSPFLLFISSIQSNEKLHNHRYTWEQMLSKCEDFYHDAVLDKSWSVTTNTSAGFQATIVSAEHKTTPSTSEEARYAQVFSPPSGNQRHSKIINNVQYHYCKSCHWNKRHLSADCPYASSREFLLTRLWKTSPCPSAPLSNSRAPEYFGLPFGFCQILAPFWVRSQPVPFAHRFVRLFHRVSPGTSVVHHHFNAFCNLPLPRLATVRRSCYHCAFPVCIPSVRRSSLV
jgi:hypothetical protein